MHAIAGIAMTIAGTLSCATALGQVGTADWFWEISADAGASWRSGLIEVRRTQASVLVRARAAWSPDAGLMFAGAKFDGIWHSVGLAGSDDTMADLWIPLVFKISFYPIESMRMGQDIKIDDYRDHLPPGQGPYWGTVGQLAPGDDGDRDLSNPATVMTYTILLDDSFGDRTVTSLFTAPPGGNTTDRFMLTYIRPDADYLFNRPLTTFHSATLRVLPCRADFNRDGQSDFFDYLDFVQAFADESPAADFNGDAQIDFFDYLEYVEAFVAACE